MQQKEIIVSSEILQACPGFVGCAVYAAVQNTTFNQELWQEISTFSANIRQQINIDEVKLIPSIYATRETYKRCGKDPNRYRPSGEQLIRRILQGKELYQISTIVDLVNLASLRFGYSIGGFDYDQISGNKLTLGIGQANEPYEGIGRGLLNIEGMPVYRDDTGGVGTPTSDNERTKLDISTTQFLALINGYDGNLEQVHACGKYIAELLYKYASSNISEISIHTYPAK